MTKVSNKIIKVLSISPGLNYCGGVETYLMSYYRKLDFNIINMDFVTHDISGSNYKNEIERNGGKVFLLPKFSVKNIFKVMNNIKTFFEQNHDYDIIHCNMANAAPFYFYYAKKYGIKVRILHSHQTKYAATFSHSIRNVPLIWLGKKLATDYVACTVDAGRFLFKNKKFVVINNSIDITKFKYNKKNREKIRKELNLSNKIVIIHISILEPEKNHNFIIELLNFMVNLNCDVKLLLIGSGSLKNMIKEKIKELKLKNHVILINDVTNPEDYYQAMDVFIFPSHYEGLGIVAIEAQVSGLPVICNETLPRDIDVTNNIVRLSLKDNYELWANKILELSKIKRKDCSKIMKDTKFSIDNEAKKLNNYYINLCRKE